MYCTCKPQLLPEKRTGFPLNVWLVWRDGKWAVLNINHASSFNHSRKSDWCYSKDKRHWAFTGSVETERCAVLEARDVSRCWGKIALKACVASVESTVKRRIVKERPIRETLKPRCGGNRRTIVGSRSNSVSLFLPFLSFLTWRAILRLGVWMK